MKNAINENTVTEVQTSFSKPISRRKHRKERIREKDSRITFFDALHLRISSTITTKEGIATFREGVDNNLR